LQDTGAYFQHALFNEHTKGDRIKVYMYICIYIHTYIYI
jgi:hypothetical protein